MNCPTGVLYRYIDESSEDGQSIRLVDFAVVKATAKGIWIADWSKRRFVLNDSRKRYAHPTKEEALASFIVRKQRQKAIYAARHDAAQWVLEEAIAMRDAGVTAPRSILPTYFAPIA